MGRVEPTKIFREESKKLISFLTEKYTLKKCPDGFEVTFL